MLLVYICKSLCPIQDKDFCKLYCALAQWKGSKLICKDLSSAQYFLAFLQAFWGVSIYLVFYPCAHRLAGLSLPEVTYSSPYIKAPRYAPQSLQSYAAA